MLLAPSRVLSQTQFQISVQRPSIPLSAPQLASAWLPLECKSLNNGMARLCSAQIYPVSVDPTLGK